MLFSTEQMPFVIKMIPVLEASDIKAEMGALRVFGASLARRFWRLSGKHVFTLNEAG